MTLQQKPGAMKCELYKTMSLMSHVTECYWTECGEEQLMWCQKSNIDSLLLKGQEMLFLSWDAGWKSYPNAKRCLHMFHWLCKGFRHAGWKPLHNQWNIRFLLVILIAFNGTVWDAGIVRSLDGQDIDLIKNLCWDHKAAVRLNESNLVRTQWICRGDVW